MYDAILGRFLQRDPAPHSGAACAYEYAKSEPPNVSDPRGTITVTAIRSDKLACGGRLVRWVFSLSNRAPRDGYIVQQITMTEDVKNCVRCPTWRLYPPTQVYWEGWFVQAGERDTWVTGRAGFTDQSGKRSRPNTCGFNVARGVIKFFPQEGPGPHTDDIGDVGRDVENAGGWRTNNPDTQAKSLPSTTQRPPWWFQASIEGPTSRFASSEWKCCDCAADFNQLGVGPPRGGEDVWK
jgi:hypothetical protein